VRKSDVCVASPHHDAKLWSCADTTSSSLYFYSLSLNLVDSTSLEHTAYGEFIHAGGSGNG
jgi:hypothetical protein